MEDGLTPLHLAALAGDAEALGAALAGAEVDAQDSRGSTALLRAAEVGSLACAQALLGAGARSDAVDRRQWSPVRAAVAGGHVAVLRALIEAGADVNLAACGGESAAWAAAESGGDARLACLEELIRAGADLSAANFFGSAPLHVAAGGGHLDAVLALVAAGVDANAVDCVRESAVFYACRAGSVPCLRALIAAGADVNRPNQSGATPLIAAAKNCTLSPAARCACARELLRAGADVNRENCFHATALWNACDGICEPLVRLLLAQPGIELETRAHGGTPLEHALGHVFYRKSASLVWLLRRAGAAFPARAQVKEPEKLDFYLAYRQRRADERYLVAWAVTVGAGLSTYLARAVAEFL